MSAQASTISGTACTSKLLMRFSGVRSILRSAALKVDDKIYIAKVKSTLVIAVHLERSSL
jgi:hypothetical protein